MKATAKLCEEKLKVLDKTRAGKRTSEEYDDMHDILKAGTKLGEKSSVNEIVEFYKRFTRATDRYTLFHDTVFGPITKDGRKRLEISKDLSEYGKTVGKEIEDKAAKLRDKDMSMEKRILKRKEAVTKLTVKGDEQRELFRIERRQKVESAQKRVEANVVRSEHVRKI